MTLEYKVVGSTMKSEVANHTNNSVQWKSRPHWAFLLLAFSLIFVFSIILCYDVVWQHHEFFNLLVPAAFRNGADIYIADFKRAFDWVSFDGYERGRFLSNLLNLFSIKAQFMLAEYFVPHPSLSFSWPVILITTPVTLFFAVSNMVGCRYTATLAVAFYFCMAGPLSALTMLFHIGKPLTIFFSAVLVLLLSLSYRRQEGGVNISLGDYVLSFFLFTAGFLSLNSDEMGGIFILAAWIFFPSLIYSRRGVMMMLASGSAIAFYACWLLLVSPVLVPWLGFGPFDFLGAMGRLHVSDRGDLPNFLSNSWVYPWNGAMFLSEIFVPYNKSVAAQFSVQSGYMDWVVENASENALVFPSGEKLYITIAVIVLGFVLVALLTALLWMGGPEKRHRQAFYGSLGAFIFSTIWVSAIVRAAMNGSFYYGGLISIPLSIGLAAVLSPGAARSFINLRVVLAMLLMLISGFNFLGSNVVWRAQPKHADGTPVDTSYERALHVWKNEVLPHELADWPWLQAHQHYQLTRRVIRMVDAQVERWIEEESIDSSTEVAYILREYQPNLRTGLYAVMVGHPIFDRRNDIKDIIRETCGVCIHVNPAGVAKVVVRDRRIAKGDLPEILRAKVE